jgi:CBS domain-containing protein
MQKEIRFHSTSDLIVIHHRDDIERAAQLMSTIKTRHLPVVDDFGAIVGLLSDRDLPQSVKKNQARYFSSSNVSGGAIADSFVQNYMSWPVESIDENASIADAARMMVDKKISSLIVSHDSMAVGIVTTQDILKALIMSESESPAEAVKDRIMSAIYNSPIGSIVESLSNTGL